MKKLFSIVDKKLTEPEIIDYVCDFLLQEGVVTKNYRNFVHERAKMTSLFIGNGLIIPHATDEGRTEVVNKGAVLATWFKKPISYEGNLVHFSVTLAVDGDDHMDLLSEIAIRFSDIDEVEKVVKTGDVETIRKFLGV